MSCVYTSNSLQSLILIYIKGEIDHVELLNAMDEKIARAKEEAASRKVIIEKVDRWMLARDEERWLEEYDQVLRYTIALLRQQLHFISVV